MILDHLSLTDLTCLTPIVLLEGCCSAALARRCPVLHLERQDNKVPYFAPKSQLRRLNISKNPINKSTLK